MQRVLQWRPWSELPLRTHKAMVLRRKTSKNKKHHVEVFVGSVSTIKVGKERGERRPALSTVTHHGELPHAPYAFQMTQGICMQVKCLLWSETRIETRVFAWV